MLKSLHISDLAIIENADISFKDGFSVLTGESGAGKSLLIDSLSLLLGDRASSELIRSGKDKAIIKGVFSLDRKEAKSILNSLGVECINDELTIERNISKTKNQIKLNGVSTTLADLLKLAPHLADIHNQFDSQKILNPENYLSMVDGYSSSIVKPVKDDYLIALDNYKKAKNAYETLINKKKKIDENHDFYDYQAKELKAFGLYEGEEEEIQSEIAILSNYDKVYALSQEALEIIDKDSLSDLYDLAQALKKLESFKGSYKETRESLEESYFGLEDTLSSLKKELDAGDYDPNRLEELQQRQSDLSSLKRKYKKSESELISYLSELEGLLKDKENIDVDIQDAEKELSKAKHALYLSGVNLSKARQVVAKQIEKDLGKNLEDLLLESKFKISFRPLEEVSLEGLIKEDGLDEIDFLIETNVGEGLKSLSKVVSGGEASRIMLAIKAIYIKSNKTPTVIFDEIDTGLSGEASLAVARKIKEISLSSQVISISHLPQVAALSDHHILVSKAVDEGRTFVSIRELGIDEKIVEIAKLISLGEVTPIQLEYAKEMVLNK